MKVTFQEYTSLGLVQACCFAIIEPIFSRFHLGYFHTTIHQFLANILFGGIFLQTCRNMRNSPGMKLNLVLGKEKKLQRMLHPIYVSLFPFLVWILEIVQDRVIKFCCNGVNPAWDYSYDPKWSRLNGAIHLGFYIYWVGLALIIDLVDIEWFLDILHVHFGLIVPTKPKGVEKFHCS